MDKLRLFFWCLNNLKKDPRFVPGQGDLSISYYNAVKGNGSFEKQIFSKFRPWWFVSLSFISGSNPGSLLFIIQTL